MTYFKKLRALDNGYTIYLELDGAGNQMGRLTATPESAQKWADARNIEIRT